MSDESAPSPDRAAELAEARRVALEGMKALEKAAWSHGFHEGFSAGWEAGRKRLQEVMEQVTAQPEPASTRVSQPTSLALFPMDAAGPNIRAADVVLQIISSRPGIRGIEIVNATLDAGSPMLERTVRTALYRMKRDGRIRNLGGRWFTAEAAPEGSTADGDENDA
jgi:hypothetical protein